MKVVVDTNIIIDHLKGLSEARQQLKNIENEVYEGYISTITIMELLSAPRFSEKRCETINNLLKIFEHIPVDRKIAATAGKFLSIYRASHGLEPMDALIAATAYINEAVLFTLNIKHFRYIEGLVSINPYTMIND
ncbi:type II toxin-antitoxin system VapC family toxin [Desulfoscipio gibsoniae]|uniref:Putative nucleic acid-binding protein, contains PIN domain n=1 Tax=Desulfoscipio gibsoniae DSM 7213 TaxID=767817 RepID=R4KNP3_9FIRM|nr:type II toxin-antitoxin system VapC family toxin [Desulfoscipio gibsoniae]AGL02170.1 putative nucleic acid-binding protein, contains PIN domain [Desulfoscipio gibsoniae DSM 7213]